MPSIALPDVLDKVKRDSFFEIKDLLKLRYLLCRAVGLIGSLFDRSQDFMETNKQLQGHLEHCRHEYSLPSPLPESLISFTNAKVHEWVTGRHLDLPLFLLKIAYDVRGSMVEGKTEMQMGNNNKISPDFPPISELETLLEAYALNTPPKIDIWNVVKLLEKASSSLEILALALFAVKFLERSFSHTRSCSKARSKDREKSTDPFAGVFASYTKMIFARIRENKNVLVSLDPKYSLAGETFTEDENYLEQFIKENSMLESAACVSIETSHRESIAEMQSAIAHLESVFGLDSQFEKLTI